MRNKKCNMLLLVSFRFIPVWTFTFGTSNRRMLALSVSRNPDMTTDITLVSFNLYYCHCWLLYRVLVIYLCWYILAVYTININIPMVYTNGIGANKEYDF